MIPETTKPIVEYILRMYTDHAGRSQYRPIVVGLSGPQGSGKSTVVNQVAMRLRERNLQVVEFSLDDVYLTHSDQVELAQTSQNKLVSHRGLPGTHDVELCTTVLESLINQVPANVPIYDKSAFQGQGDRSTESIEVLPPYQVVLLEGWCLGFRSLPEAEVRERWTRSQQASTGDYHTILGTHSLEDILFVNSQLRSYDAVWDKLDALIQLQAQDIGYVYDWRQQQEHALIKTRGTGMSDEQVRQFVDGYMPAYELYLHTLEKHRTLAIELDSQRRVVSVHPPL